MLVQRLDERFVGYLIRQMVLFQSVHGNPDFAAFIVELLLWEEQIGRNALLIGLKVVRFHGIDIAGQCMKL